MLVIMPNFGNFTVPTDKNTTLVQIFKIQPKIVLFKENIKEPFQSCKKNFPLWL